MGRGIAPAHVRFREATWITSGDGPIGGPHEGRSIGMSGKNPPPTWPRGGPSGPPPSGRLPGLPPSGPPTQPPGKGWPQAQSAPPTFGGGPPYFGGPPPPPGSPSAPRRRRWPIVLAGVLAVLLVAGLSVAAWAYFTGRFGVGPLSAKDEAAVSAIADNVEAPAWADADARECAADEFVHASRSADLEKRGVIDADGDGWTCRANGATRRRRHTSRRSSTAPTTGPSRSAMSGSREHRLPGRHRCLDDGGLLRRGDPHALRGPGGRGRRARRGGESPRRVLRRGPPEPSANARPGYRAVVFKFDELGPDAGEATLQVRDDGAWKPIDGNTHSVDTDAGGRKGCVDAQVEASFPWGTTTATDKRFCGTSKPPRIWWSSQEVHLHGRLHHLGPALRGFRILRVRERAAARERRRLQLRERSV